MKTIFILWLMLIPLLGIADEVRVEISPQRPVAGEQFQTHFRVFTDSSEEPVINFSPSGVEVIGKSNQGISTRTIYSNGKLTVTREFLIVYELAASKAGTAYLRDITVQVAGATLRHPSVNIYVLKEAEEPEDVFVSAEVPKTEVFVGEGITVRYFLYSKAPVNALDIKKYPKLNNFLKRFLQEPDRMERVSARGTVYLRSQIYAAKLFPEKTGELKIDSLSLSATYPVTRGNDPFGAFGLSREFKTRTFNSQVVPIIVKPLPTPVPPHFTGLVGKHEFDLNLNQNKLIVNEPLEIKLTIAGPGALENLEAPSLIKHPALEEFESTGDLKINDAESATKTFEYTFLARENFQLPASTITLSYLDPATGRYVATDLSLPDITVAGGGAASPKKSETSKAKENDSPLKALPKIPEKMSGPLLSSSFSWSQVIPYLNLALLGLAVLLVLGWFVKTRPLPRFHGTASVPSEFKKGHFSFGNFARWMTPLIQKTGKSPLMIIRESELDEGTKKYFESLITSADASYSSRKGELNFNYEARHFKQLAQAIENARNEDRPESA